MKYSRLILVSLWIAALPALAINAPTATAPQQESVTVLLTLPTTHTDGSTVLPGERKQVNLYASWLPAVVSVPEPGNTYTFVLAPGTCVTQNIDKVDATEVDSSGVENAPATAKVTWSACGPKPLMSSPAVTLTRTH